MEILINNMKNLLIIVSLILTQSCIAFAQNYCVNDTIVREIQFPLTLDDKTEFFYFNDEWIPGAHPGLVEVEAIQKAEVKNDEYGNRAIFLTVSPETLAQIKAEARKIWVNLDTRCEFPGGNGKLKEWIEENIRIPEGFKGSERVFVKFTVHPDGSISDPTIFRRPSKNEAVNQEAIRLVNALPKFRVKYYTPQKKNFHLTLPITFKEPGVIFIRGGESSFINQFSEIEPKIKQLYENLVFATAKDPDFNITDICTADFIERLEKANDSDSKGYATWLLRSGMQDGDDTPSRIISIVPSADNTVIVNWSDMGHKGSTNFTLVKSDGEWKINNATVPEGYNPL